MPAAYFEDLSFFFVVKYSQKKGGVFSKKIVDRYMERQDESIENKLFVIEGLKKMETY